MEIKCVGLNIAAILEAIFHTTRKAVLGIEYSQSQRV